MTCNKTQPAPVSITNLFLNQTAPSLASIKGIATVGNLSLSFQVQAGNPNRLVVTDVSPVPSVCGVNALLAGASGPSTAPAGLAGLGSTSTSNGTAAIVLAILAVLAAGALFYFFGHHITNKMQGIAAKAVHAMVLLQVVQFVIGAAAVGSPVWAAGSGITFGLWSVCPTGSACVTPATALSADIHLFQAVQALAALGLIASILGMFMYCFAVACATHAANHSWAFKAMFGFVVFESMCWFFAICFFGGYYNDELSGKLSLQWGFGLAIFAWLWAVLCIPVAKLPINPVPDTVTKA